MPPANKGYTTPDLVGAYMGVTLDSAQSAQSDVLTGAAEGFLDRWTGYPYASGTSQTVIDEYYQPQQDSYGVIQLRESPVGAVIAVRRVPNGTSPADDVPFTVRDLMNGTIFVPSAIQLPPAGFQNLPTYSWPGGMIPEAPFRNRNLWVTYLSLRGVPAIVSTIATMLVAHWLRWNINPDQFGISQYTLGQDIHAQIRSPEALPTEAMPLLWSIKRWTLA